MSEEQEVRSNVAASWRLNKPAPDLGVICKKRNGYTGEMKV